jgi:excisionase family DNA binding protein
MTPREARELAQAVTRELQKKPPPPQLALSIDDASRALSIGRDSLYALLDVDGGIPTCRVGARRLIRVAALTEFLERTEGHR